MKITVRELLEKVCKDWDSILLVVGIISMFFVPSLKIIGAALVVVGSLSLLKKKGVIAVEIKYDK